MRATHPSNRELTDDILDQLVLAEYPYPISVNYRRLLETEGWLLRLDQCIRVFDYSLRAVTLAVLSQYLMRDIHEVSERSLNERLYRKLPEACLGDWKEFLFLGLAAYRDHPKRFFMPELYDLYWDTTQKPPIARKRVKAPFQRLVEIRNTWGHSLPEASEAAPWETLAKEAMHLLRTVLRTFSFLSNYDLIRVREQYGREYEYERYAGQEVTIQCKHLHEKGKEKLQAGWFYLSRKDRSVLRLHPLLVPWPGERDQELVEGKGGDAAMYGKFTSEGVEYLATARVEACKAYDPELLAQFRELIYYTIEHIKMARERMDLSWPTLRRAAEELTAEQMGTMREKYQPELYLQRDETLRRFREFLASDKVCFVLTGKSGVGKSNFVLSLGNEYAGREDVCVLTYNAARLPIPETMLQMINQHLLGYVAGERGAAMQPLAELEKRGDMAGKTFIVVFDAVNENVDGKALLRQIDHMVGEVRYPWFKVVITSRPQAWQFLKRGMSLAEGRYYREPGSDELWVELEGFTYTEENRLKPFGWEELPKVYSKYREKYALLTSYDELTSQLRSILRDPLMLRLVADTYSRQAIPGNIRVNDIYERYIQALVKTERLTEGDKVFLEQELVPLMIAEDHPDNKLTASQLQAALTRDGRPLWELIHNEDILPGGQPVNAGYARLANAEILIEQGPPTDYEIRFRYERFYDHFGGKRILELVSAAPSREEAYLGWVKRIPTSPFLWGAIQTALEMELEEGRNHVIESLAVSREALTKEMVVAVLGSFGQENAGAVEAIIQTMYEKDDPEVTKTALAVAGDLGLGAVLLSAVRHPDAGVRLEATRCAYSLWQKKPDEGWRVLNAWVNEIRGAFGLPRTKVLESCLLLSLFIMADPKSLGESSEFISPSLQNVWRGILGNVLFIGPRDSSAKRRVRGLILTRAGHFLGSMLRGTYTRRAGLEGKSLLSLLADSFPVSSTRRGDLGQLLDCIDLPYEEILEHEDLLTEVLTWNDFLTTTVVFLTLLLKSPMGEDCGLGLVQRLFRRTLQVERPLLCSGYLAMSAWFLIGREAGQPTDAAVAVYRDMMEEYIDATLGLCYSSGGERFVNLGVDLFCDTEYKKYDNEQPTMLIHALEKAVSSNELVVLDALCSEILRLSNTLGHPQLALEAARTLLKYDDALTRDRLVNCLASIRQRHPDRVEDFLEDNNIPGETRHLVRAREVIADIRTTNLTSSLALLITRALSDPTIKASIIGLLREALHCDSMDVWLGITVKELVNVLYGQPVV